MKKKQDFLFSILIIITISVLVFALTPRQVQNDLFYDIKIGDFILKNGIDLKDHFSFLTLNYTYPHWLFDVIVSLIYNSFSFRGIYVFVMFAFAILLFLVYKTSNKMNANNKIISFVLLFLVSNFLRPGITARSQILSYILFIIQIYLLESFTKTKNTKYLIGLPILSLLLANVHGTIWPFQFVLYLPYIAEHIMYLVSKKKKLKVKVSSNKLYIEDVSHFKKLYLYIFISLIVVLFTPSFGIAFTYFIKIMHTSTVHVILEHRATALAENILYLFLLIFLLLLFILTKTKIKLRDFLMIGGLIFVSLFSVRHILLFASIGLLFVSRYLSDVVNEESSETCYTLYSYITKPVFLFLILLVLVVTCIYNYKINAKKEYYSSKDYPVQAVSYIKKNLDYKNIRLFNNYNEGSYILFNDIKVFIDSRSDLYTDVFNKGITVFDDWLKVSGDLNYENVFLKYKFTHILIKTDENLYKLLEKDKNYKVIYEDPDFVLMEKINN